MACLLLVSWSTSVYGGWEEGGGLREDANGTIAHSDIKDTIRREMSWDLKDGILAVGQWLMSVYWVGGGGGGGD